MQQTTVNFGAAGATGTTGLARQISLPAEYKPLRFPSFPALERTAVMGFNVPATLEIPAGSTVVPTNVTVCRQATYPVWADRTAPLYYAVSYNTVSQTSTILGSSAVSYTVQPTVRIWETSGSGALIPFVPPISNNTKPFSWAIMGKDAPGAEYVYIPASCISTSKVVIIGSSAPSGAIAVNAMATLEWWISPEETVTTSIPVVIAATTFGKDAALSAPINTGVLGYWVRPKEVVVEANGAWTSPPYFTVHIQVSSTAMTYTAGANTGTFTGVALTNAVTHVPLAGPTEFTNSTLPWYATRVTASALLCTNVTQVLNKNGAVLGGRVSPAVYSPWNLPVDYIGNLHPAEKAYLPLETGIYTYCPPSTDLLTFQDYTLNTSAGASSAPVYNLANDSLYNRLIFQPNPSSPEIMACTITWHIEFRTSSALFEVGLCGLTLEALHQAQISLSQLGFFFENPKHKGILAAGLKAAKKYVPKIIAAASPTAGRIIKVFQKGKNGGRKGKRQAPHKQPAPKPHAAVKPPPGPSQPKTTSMATSGAMPKKLKSGLQMYLDAHR